MDSCFGMNPGKEQEFASTPVAQAACLYMDVSHAMILQRDDSWQLVDALETLDACVFLCESPSGCRDEGECTV